MANRQAQYNNPETIAFESRVNTAISEYTTFSNSYKHDVKGLIQKNSPALLMLIPESVVTGRTFPDAGKINSFKGTNKFLLTSFNESRAERTQVLETFGKPAIFFFDENVRTYSFSGLLLDNATSEFVKNDANNLNWSDNFKKFYEDFLRATRLVTNREIALMSVNDNLIYGYPTSLQMNTDSNQPHLVSFSMSFLVIKHTYPKASVPVGDSEYELAGKYHLHDLGKKLSSMQNELINLASEKDSEGFNLEDLEKLELAIYDLEVMIGDLNIDLQEKMNTLYASKSKGSDNLAIQGLINEAGFKYQNEVEWYNSGAEDYKIK